MEEYTDRGHAVSVHPANIKAIPEGEWERGGMPWQTKYCPVSNTSLCPNKKVNSQCVLPALSYGSETWRVTKASERKLKSMKGNRENNAVG